MKQFIPLMLILLAKYLQWTCVTTLFYFTLFFIDSLFGLLTVIWLRRVTFCWVQRNKLDKDTVQLQTWLVKNRLKSLNRLLRQKAANIKYT